MSHLTNFEQHSRGVSTDVNRYISERTITKVVMIPYLSPKFEGLNM